MDPEPVIDDLHSRTEFLEYRLKGSRNLQPECLYDHLARISVVFNTRSKLVPEAVKTTPKFSIVCCIYASKSPAASSRLSVTFQIS